MFNLTTYRFSACSIKQFNLQACLKIAFGLRVKSLITLCILMGLAQKLVLVFAIGWSSSVPSFSLIGLRVCELEPTLLFVRKEEEEEALFYQSVLVRKFLPKLGFSFISRYSLTQFIVCTIRHPSDVQPSQEMILAFSIQQFTLQGGQQVYLFLRE